MASHKSPSLKKERVIILRLIKHGESDLIVHALNRQGARMGFYAKGGLKSKKRFGGGILEPTHYCEVSYKMKPDIDGSPLHTLLEAQLVQGFDHLREDYDRLQVALYFLRVMSKISQEGLVDSKDMFDLLGNSLKAAESSLDVQKLKLHFEIKVLVNQGVLPAEAYNSDWSQLPIKEHSSLDVDRQTEWSIHHALEAYLGTLT
jgi:DNA repair protein RecO (recombination protein O)